MTIVNDLPIRVTVNFEHVYQERPDEVLDMLLPAVPRKDDIIHHPRLKKRSYQVVLVEWRERGVEITVSDW